MREKIVQKLTHSFTPTQLEVIDESSHHAGHSGAKPGGETHFHVTIISHAFAGQNRVKRHQAVYKALAEELATQVHALSLTTLTPEESSAQ